jgi:Fur family transcriptional regulator, stress-responsive regulator
VDRLAAQLRQAGLRNTPQRRAVLIALGRAPHSTAAELAAAVTTAASRVGAAGDPAVASVDGLSRQGLYNVLEDLTRAGLVQSIEPAGSAARYEMRVGDNHHHLVCRRCGRIEDVSCAVGAAPCLQPLEFEGFTVDEAEVIWWGMCDACSGSKEQA